MIDVIKLVAVENNVEINRKSQVEFLFEYQKSVLITLSEQGVLNDMQCQQCIEKLAWQFRK